MDIFGDLTVLANIILLVCYVLAGIVFIHRRRVDLQFLILYFAISLLLPVIIFENILYLETAYSYFDYNYNVLFMRLLFSLGIIAYFIYNLHLMTIEDMPTFPVTITAIISGFAIGAMAVSAQIDDSREQPIFYDPISGGFLFILSLMIFNIIGASGLIISVLRSNSINFGEDLSNIDIIAILFFFISPIVIFLARIIGLDIIAVNAIFLLTEISFILHLLNYILYPINFGYPIKSELVSMSIINIEKNVVIAGFSTRKDENFNKLQGMTIMAVDSVLKDVFEVDAREKENYSLDYGDTILLRYKNYLLVSLFYGKGKKIGKLLLSLFLRNFNHSTEYDPVKFKQIVDQYLMTFFKKKTELTEDNIYFSNS